MKSNKKGDLENSLSLNTTNAIVNALSNNNVSCGDNCVARDKKQVKLVKMIDFNQYYKHFVFIRDKDGYLEKRLDLAIPVNVYFQLV